MTGKCRFPVVIGWKATAGAELLDQWLEALASNDRLAAFLETTDATPAEVEQAMQINSDSRLRALKIGLLLMALVSLLAIFPASRLPNYKPGEVPSNPPLPKPTREED
jgi:hypothetical protein